MNFFYRALVVKALLYILLERRLLLVLQNIASNVAMGTVRRLI